MTECNPCRCVDAMLLRFQPLNCQPVNSQLRDTQTLDVGRSSSWAGHASIGWVRVVIVGVVVVAGVAEVVIVVVANARF